MGKKQSHKSSHKISKKSFSGKKQQQEGLNSLIKVLKPRVYITDSSTFKSLVQELTGNGNIINGSPSYPPPPLSVIDLDDHGYQENSPDFSSFDSSQVNNFIPTSTTTFDYSPLQIEDNGFRESTSPNFSFDSSQVNSTVNIPTSFGGDYLPQIGNDGFKESSDGSSAAFSFESEVNVATSFPNFFEANDITNKETGFSQYKEIESWLLEVDPMAYSYVDDYCYVPNSAQQEVCVSDYDMSGSHMIIL